MSGADHFDTASVYAGLAPASEAAIAAFDAAFDAFAPAPDLVAGAPARTLSEAMAEFVQSITKMDIERVNRRSGWWSRLTGADLEARLELEVAARSFTQDMGRLASAARSANRARTSMKSDIERLETIKPRHEALAERTDAFLRDADSGHPVVARLQRRLANLDTVIASNRLLVAQMHIAIDHLTTLLDRYVDIERRLFPVWRHHALAVAQSPGDGIEPGALEQLRAVRTRFRAHFNPAEAVGP